MINNSINSDADVAQISIRHPEDDDGWLENHIITPSQTDQTFPWKRASLLLGAIIIITIVLWIIAGVTYQMYLPKSKSILVIAYTFGLRHALDADHIAAIDNVTRRLVQEGQKPVAVGTFFSLGHSTIVIIATMLVAAISSSIQDKFDLYNSYASNVGTSISLSFLYFISIINGVSIYMIIHDIKRLQYHQQINPNHIVSINEINNGFFARFFGQYLFKLINKSYKMYYIGFLFGLGFDTATEISLLAITCLQAVNGTAIWCILFLPLLFTCGMVLLDTIDGILMLGVYDWAMIQPDKKLYYNLIITITSFLFAIFIATIELCSVIANNYNVDMNAPFWVFINTATDDNNFFVIGISLLFAFVIGWLASKVVYGCGSPGSFTTSDSTGGGGVCASGGSNSTGGGSTISTSGGGVSGEGEPALHVDTAVDIDATPECAASVIAVDDSSVVKPMDIEADMKGVAAPVDHNEGDACEGGSGHKAC